MKIPNADYLERTGTENLSARLWRLPPGSANSWHKHVRQEEFHFVLEGMGRMRVGRKTLTVPKHGGVLVGPEELRQVFNDTDAEVLCLIVGAPEELEISPRLEVADGPLADLSRGPDAAPAGARPFGGLTVSREDRADRCMRVGAELPSLGGRSWFCLGSWAELRFLFRPRNLLLPVMLDVRSRPSPRLLPWLLWLCSLLPVAAVPPDYTIEEGAVRLRGVGPGNPIIYDNDFWTDVPDAAYLWAKATLGEAELVGNVITRCTFGWEKKYAHSLEQSVEEAGKLFRLARESGLRNVPKPIVGSTRALRRPASGRLEDTEFERTAGSALMVAEARKATPDEPLLIFVGGSCTTVASAYLTDASIKDRVVVFQIDGGAYNGSDRWAWEIAMKHLPFANWARGYFWKEVSTWPVARFDELPKNPLCDWLRKHARSDLGAANQWGDGPWIIHLFAPRSLTKAVPWDSHAITIPREGTNSKAMEDEFFQTMRNRELFSAR